MRKIHLFDIPLYHPDGFKHVGDRKIRLYDPVDAVIAADAVGGGGAAAAVTDAAIGATADAAAAEAAQTAAFNTGVVGGDVATAGGAAATVDASTVSADTPPLAETPTPTAPSELPPTSEAPPTTETPTTPTSPLSPTTGPANMLNGALCQYTTATGADATVPGSAPSNFNITDQLKRTAIQQGINKILQPLPVTKKPVTTGASAPVAQPLLPNYIQPASSPLTGTNLYSSSNPSPSLFLSPLQSSGLTPSQQNQLYNPNAGVLGATTTPNLVPGSAQPTSYIFPGESRVVGFKDGGGAHVPEFITGHTGHYAQGRGTGQSDDIPALLKDGDYVMDADIVAALGDGSNKAGADALHHFMNQYPHKHYEGHSTGGHINAMIADGEFVFPASLVTALGNGSNKEGAKKLDEMREKIREHKRSASITKIPPKAKSPLSYMEGK